MHQSLLRRLSLVATAALVASGVAMAQSSSSGNGGTSNATGAVNGSAGTSGLPGDEPTMTRERNASPSSPPTDYNQVDPTSAGNSDATAAKPDKARHSGTHYKKKAKRARDAASTPSVMDDPSHAGGGSGNSSVR